MEQIALCHFKHKGQEYNYGDPVDAEVAAAMPNAVGPKPLTESDLNSMTKAELLEALKAREGIGQDQEESA